ncbi:cytidine deaminase [Pseudodesulfovibrio sediminis]|uniref:Cytidine deaminase n=1 Tax=Pseudodesulfovibrio sediminis TaxID=2810563 RepID=A0ABM9SE83_9BACT|nr:cytidine deaminase [Pseudodesulfovibrio sediminis]BCS89145.1 cytidine deaminase [Pseudodesulfovibrio sediminis]
MIDIQELIRLATEARNTAHVPYSNHPVGAAIVTDSGNIFTGCNVENAAYPLGSCAEQSAISAMVRGGEKTISVIVVVGPTLEPCTPCGGCRQRIREFSTPQTIIHACNEQEVLLTMTMDELLPQSFGPENLKKI